MPHGDQEYVEALLGYQARSWSCALTGKGKLTCRPTISPAPPAPFSSSYLYLRQLSLFCCRFEEALLSERQAQRKGEVKPVNFGRILRELQHERVLFATALAFSLVTSAVGQLTPWLMGRLLDSLNTEGAEFATAIELLLGMLGVSLFSGLFGFLQRNVFTYISQSAVKRLRERVHFNVRSSLSNSDPQQVMLRTLQCAHAPLLS